MKCYMLFITLAPLTPSILKLADVTDDNAYKAKPFRCML